MTQGSPLHQALAARRAAERRLDGAGPDDPARPSMRADVERIRLAYQALFDEIEDVAGHGTTGGSARTVAERQRAADADH